MQNSNNAKVIEPNQEYLISIKPYFDNEYTLLSSYQNSGSETTFEFLYRIIFERYGLSPDEEYSNSTNQTFFAIFFSYFLIYNLPNKFFFVSRLFLIFLI